jgi:threonine-phosphate decarboxylase
MSLKLDDRRHAVEKAVHGGEVWKYYPIVDFSSNVNPLGPPESVLVALKNGIWRIKYYPDVEGEKLKYRLAEHLFLSPKNIALGNGSTELIKNFCEAFVRPGDEVVIAEPTFSEYGVWCDWIGAKTRRVYADSSSGFMVDLDGIMQMPADVIFLCNPNNPTGVLAGDIRALVGWAHRQGALVLVDEAYIDFTSATSVCSLVEEYPNLCVLRSMTKFYSLPGLRVGYAVGDEDLIRALDGVRIPWNVNVLAELAAISALRDEEYVRNSKRYIEREKAFLLDGLKALGIRVYPSSTNFFLFDLGDFGITARWFKEELLERGFLIRDCSSFKGLNEYYARISVGKREDNVRLLKAMRELLVDGVGGGYDEINC